MPSGGGGVGPRLEDHTASPFMGMPEGTGPRASGTRPRAPLCDGVELQLLERPAGVRRDSAPAGGRSSCPQIVASPRRRYTVWWSLTWSW